MAAVSMVGVTGGLADLIADGRIRGRPLGGTDRAIRLTYGPAMMNGPFAIVVANQDSMVAFTDRSKLRPLVGAENGSKLYVSSEEAAIRAMDPDIDARWIFGLSSKS